MEHPKNDEKFENNVPHEHVQSPLIKVTDDDKFDENTQKIESAIDEIFNFQKPEDDAHHSLQLLDRAGTDDAPSDTTGNGLANPTNMSGVISNGIERRVPFEFGSEFGGIIPESIPDVNIYQHKKTVAQGMMDLALFSANANQLRYVLESNDHPYFYTGVILISISLMFQVAVGVGLLLNTRYNVKNKKEICIANKISNFTIVGIFLVTVINVFISAFGVASGGGAGIIITPRSGDDEGE